MKTTRSRTKIWKTAGVSLGVLLTGVVSASPSMAAPNANAAPIAFERACAASQHAGEVACNAVVDHSRSQTTSDAATNALKSKTTSTTLNTVVNGYKPADLQAAYAIPADTSGIKKTVAVVVAYDDPTAANDLNTYRAQFGLPSCTTANGCFKKVNEYGSTTSLPSSNAGWATEASLDVDMVSAACPTCNILLLEAKSASITDLGTAVNTAVKMGATVVNNSYGGSEFSSEANYDTYYNHPGVAITVSAGDNGYGVQYPAASPYVTAVGGTTLTRNSTARGWGETVWGSSAGGSGTGSGCSLYEAKPSWQTDSGCSKRTVADVSAVSNPSTGVAVYDSTPYNGSAGWMVVGGTSAASPIVAGIYAVAGVPTAGTYPSSYPYKNTTALNDVVSGANGSCSIAYLCTAATGFDGPTGLGTPKGLAAF